MAKEPEFVNLLPHVDMTTLLRNDDGRGCGPELGGDYPGGRTRPTLAHPPAPLAGRPPGREPR